MTMEGPVGSIVRVRSILSGEVVWDWSPGNASDCICHGKWASRNAELYAADENP